jgi:carbamoyltransferase
MLSIVASHPYHDASIAYFNTKVGYLKFERLLQNKHFGFYITRKSVVEFQIQDFIAVYCKNKYNGNFLDINYPEHQKHQGHHRKHAYSVEILEKEKIDAHVVVDGLGDNADLWCSIFRADKIISQILTSNSGVSFGDGLGIIATYLDIEGHSLDLAGKLMGWQSYGRLNLKHYENLLKYNMNYTSTAVKGMRKDRPWKWTVASDDHLYFVDRTLPLQQKLDIAHTIHFRIGELLLEFFEKHFKPHERIGYSGGVAQNVVWNTLLKKKYPNLIIYPHCSDEGLTFGTLELFRQSKNLPKFNMSRYPFMQSDQSPHSQPTIDTIYQTAKFLNEGKIVAWYQGHGEIGPRALGHRSILMDPRIKNGKDIINRVKNREYYRPFGASVLQEYGKEYFDLDFENPYMLYLGTTQKDNLQAITHVDGTCRAQTVNESFDYAFRKLLEVFHELSGCPLLLNTSLNEAGKPIAGWIENAMNLFKSTDIDVLVVGNTIYKKQNV